MFNKNQSFNFTHQLNSARESFKQQNFLNAMSILDNFPIENRKIGWLFLKAECAVAIKDWDLSIQLLETVHPIRGVKYQNFLLESYYCSQQFEKALELCKAYHDSMLCDKSQIIQFIKLSKLTKNPQIIQDSLEYIVEKFPFFLDANAQLAEHYIATNHPQALTFLINIISIQPYQLKFHILYAQWAIKNHLYQHAHMTLMQVIYNNPMFLAADIELIRMFSEINQHVISQLTLRQMLFRHKNSNQASQKANFLETQYPFLRNIQSNNYKVVLLPEITQLFSLLNAEKHQWIELRLFCKFCFTS